MSLLNRGRFLLSCSGLVLVSFMFCWPSWGQDHPVDAREYHLKFAYDFLREAYPEIHNNEILNLFLRQHFGAPWPDNYELNFEVTRLDPEQLSHPVNDAKTGQRLPIPENSIVLAGTFLFDDSGQLESMWTNSLDNKQYQSIRDLVQSHRDWSEADASQALKDAGAHYGPGETDALVQSIHLERFDGLLGQLKIVSVEFDTFSNPDRIGDFAVLFWLVRADAQSSNGAHRTYSFLFEPFNAKLVSVKHVR